MDIGSQAVPCREASVVHLLARGEGKNVGGDSNAYGVA